jgi:protein TonB
MSIGKENPITILLGYKGPKAADNMNFILSGKYCKAAGISLLLHSTICGVFFGLGLAASNQPSLDTPSALVEVVPSSLLSSDMGDGDGAGIKETTAQSATNRLQSGAPQPEAGKSISEITQVFQKAETTEESENSQSSSYNPGAVAVDQSTTPVLQGNSNDQGFNEWSLPGNGSIQSSGLTDRDGGISEGTEKFGGQGGGGAGCAASVLRGIKPRYPAAARKAGWEGIVLVRVLVDSRGAASMVSIRESSGFPTLDESALQAVKKWRFSPATQGRKPIASFHDVRVRFHLTDS